MTDQPRLASIWAEDTQGVIGTGTKMLWRVPADLAFFKAQTVNCVVIMGRASWEALGGALLHRVSIVVTSQQDYDAPGAIVAHSLADALEQGKTQAKATGATTVWITGGAQVYAQTIDLVDELVITELDLKIDPLPEPIAMAPKIDLSVWKIDPHRSDDQWRERSGDARWKVVTYVRR